MPYLDSGSDMVLQQSIKEIKRGKTDSIIKSIYLWYKDDPMIKWKKEIKKVTPSDLGIDTTPKVVVRSMAEPPRRKGGRIVEDVTELIKALKEEARVL